MDFLARNLQTPNRSGTRALIVEESICQVNGFFSSKPILITLSTLPNKLRLLICPCAKISNKLFPMIYEMHKQYGFQSAQSADDILSLLTESVRH